MAYSSWKRALSIAVAGWLISPITQAAEPAKETAASPAPATPEKPAPPETFDAEKREHWAYQIPKRPELPSIKEEGWVKNPIDRFILAGLEEMDYPHSAEADKAALIRRVTYDLTGLPPTPKEVEAFQADTRGDAYERLVDRLLDSPHYGERWAQHWLDLAHFAETNGFELDAERPDAWRYRDWVVNALNADMPYDQFVNLQLAGDEFAPGDVNALIATGFGRCGPREIVGGNIDPVVKRQSELTEITGTVGSVFLGLTIACARCHDHKFDALPTTDYYRLQSFFAGAKMVEKPIATDAEKASYDAAVKAIAEKTGPLKQKMAELEAPYRAALLARKKSMLTDNERAILAIPEKERTPVQQRLAEGINTTLNVTWEEVVAAVAKNPADEVRREKLKLEIYAFEVKLPRPPAQAMALVDDGKEAPETHVAKRGDPKAHGPMVIPRPPGVVLASLPSEAFSEASVKPTDSTTGRRQALASWLTRPDNPLTSRVMVNRLWQHHFGRGIVATPNDFGVRGEAPTHPELLDWLATELIGQGWKLKPIHRLMVTSATYRQTSAQPANKGEAKQATDDPENTTLWRMNRRRLDAESLRDAMLVASGELNPKMGGPSVLAPLEKEVEDLIFTEAEVVDLWPVTPDPSEHVRRSLYLFRKRNVRYPLFDAFDAPDTQTACAERGVSTHALQALVLMNSDYSVARARALSSRIFREEPGNREARIRHAYRIVLARDPKPKELEQASAFLDGQTQRLLAQSKGGQVSEKAGFDPEAFKAASEAAWVDFSLAMLNRNEFVYVP
ncbi:DUF1549 and DUF1553 domain-containing protein [Singulisphaera sp. PoT]|uniref:DUF1549 and DUF1553 domain-containing protein n=1 Tax=Singulisphaera sp. PoT TaxID=3411797 RepID=UPI003BF578E5